MTDAIVLAGGREPDLGPSIPNKAFLKVGGKALVAFVVEALKDAREIGQIAIVGPAAELGREFPAGVLVVPDAGSIMDNVVAATEALKSEMPVLVAGSDIPLITSRVIKDFLAACARSRGDAFYAVVPREVMETRFPGARKTYVRLTDGSFCGGSVFLFNPKVFSRVRPFLERILAARKQPWQLAQLFGWSIVMKFASGRLSMEELVTKAKYVLGIVVQPVMMEAPELALDVDTRESENLKLIEASLAAKPSAH
jgi:GTP:adenosylcobinamide-phosphate guanylyltransferase